MATNTSLLNLNKPSYNDEVDIEVLNGNFQLLDEWLRDNVIHRHDDMFEDFVLKGLQPDTTNGTPIQDCDSLWDEIHPSAGITILLDTFDYKNGTGCLKINMDSSAGVGVLASKAISPTDLRNVSSVKLWVKSNVTTNVGDYSLLLSPHEMSLNPSKVLLFPALVANTWTMVDLPLGDVTNLTDIISIGIMMNQDKGNCSLWIDYINGVELETAIHSGIAYIQGVRISKAEERYSFEANKETYMYLDVTGTYHYLETAIEGAEPQQPEDSIKLARVIASSYNIVEVIDLRNMSALVVSPTLTDGQVTESKLAADSVSTSKLKNSSVTSSKILTDAILSYHIKDQQVTNIKIKDNDISMGNVTDNAKAGKLDAEYQTFYVQSYDVSHTEEAIPHGLNRIPAGYIVVKAEKPVQIYDGNSAWTSSHIYLKGSTPNTKVTVMIF